MKPFNRTKTAGRFIQYCYLLTLCVFSLPAHAKSPAIYDVEVIVFRYLAPNAAGEDMSVPVETGTGAVSGRFAPGELTEIPYPLYRLTPITQSLQRSREYRVLYHRAWRQPALAAVNAASYPLESEVDNGDRVQGSIKLIRERFLHLDINITMSSQPAMTPQPAMTSQPYTDTDYTPPVYSISEKRRIKSNRIYYFDHPYFGLIVRVTPYAPLESRVIYTESDTDKTDVESDTETPELNDR